MNILLISVIYPYPANDGGRAGSFKMIDFLRKHHSITLICPESNNEKAYELLEIWPDVKIKTFRNNPEIKPNKVKEFIKSIVYRKPKCDELQSTMLLFNSDLVNYYFLDLIDIVKSELASNKFDLCQVEFIDIAPIVNFIPKEIPKIFIHHELRFKRLQLEYNTLKENDLGLEWKINSTKNLELSLLNQFDKVVSLTAVDKQTLVNEGIDADKIEVSPLPVNLENHELNPDFEFKNKLIFLGPSKHYPNLDAVDWFLNNCWQKIQANCPDIKLIIAGNWAEKYKKSYAQFGNIEFCGYIKVLKEIIDGAIMVVPVRIGSGMRMKILEGASWHVPIVSTSIGAEGINMVDGQNCFLADTDTEFVDKTLKLIKSPKLQQQFILESEKVMSSMFSIEECGRKRNEIFEMVKL